MFNFLGSLFGYVLWAAYQLVNNFGVAIIIFTLVFKILLFPSSVKQQKSMASNAKFQAKQRELQKKYANNKQKYNEEVQKLYEKENIKPFGGCLSSLLPMFVMLGIFWSVSSPLSNVLHLDKNHIDLFGNFVNKIPGITFDMNNHYNQIGLLNYLNNSSILEGAKSIFTDVELAKIQNFSSGFDFLGLNLLATPSVDGGWTILIPVLSLVTSVGSQIFMMFSKNSPTKNQQGCMKFMFILLPLMTAYFAYIVPCAVGFYWIWSNIFGFVQTLIMNKFYSPEIITARSEAEHIARLELDEARIK